MFERLAALTVGYLFAALAGHWAVSALMHTAWSRVTRPLGLQQQGTPNPYPEHPAAVGLLERTLYAAAWQLGVKEFIAIWLVLKAAGSWKGWAEDVSVGSGKIAGRTAFNLFLLGAGCSLAFGVTGALIPPMLEHDDWALALLLALVVLGGTFGLRWFLQKPERESAA